MGVPLRAGKADLPSCYPPSVFLDALRVQGWEPGPVPETVIYTYARFELHLAKMPAVYTPNHMLGSGPNTFFLVDASDGRLAVNCLPIGAPAAVDQMAKQAALGVRRFISIGTCGGLQAGAQPGDVVSVISALRDEGCSYHFLPPAEQVEPTPSLSAELACALDAARVSHRPGTTWTTDVPFRETTEEVLTYRERGVAGVEMEAAALFAAAQHYGVEVASALVVDGVADDTGSTWVIDLPLASERLREVFSVCVEHFAAGA